jgi:hypothetical protein
MRPACATRCFFAHRLPTPQFYRLDPWIDRPLEGRLIVEFSSENVLIGSHWMGVETTMRVLCNLHPMHLPTANVRDKDGQGQPRCQDANSLWSWSLLLNKESFTPPRRRLRSAGDSLLEPRACRKGLVNVSRGEFPNAGGTWRRLLLHCRFAYVLDTFVSPSCDTQRSLIASNGQPVSERSSSLSILNYDIVFLRPLSCGSPH